MNESKEIPSSNMEYVILRWICLPFAVVIGSVLASAAIGLLGKFSAKVYGGMSADGWYLLYIIPFMQSWFLGYLWSMISFKVAPRGKFISSIVATTTLIILLIGGGIFIWIKFNGSYADPIEYTISAIGASIAAIFCTIKNGEENES